MRRLALASCTILWAALVCPRLPAQTPDADKPDRVLLESLSKKIDEQNAKIDALSQQILKLEQQAGPIRKYRRNRGAESGPKREQSRGCKRRNPHVDREDAQSECGGIAEVQSHRERPEAPDRPDNHDSSFREFAGLALAGGPKRLAGGASL
jgi:hypothetical protein